MSSARTIEQYVEEIIENLQDGDFDNLSDTCDTLDKMKFNSKKKYKLNYWRVMQCLGEVAVDRQVKCLAKFEKASCKCHYYPNLKCFMRLFVEMMCNVAVIKRILFNKNKILPTIFKAVRQIDEELLTVLALETTHKCLLVGKTEVTELFMKYGLLKDIYQRVKGKNDANQFSYGAINIVLCCSKLLLTISICGTDSIRRQVRRSPVLRIMGEYIEKLAANKVDKMGVLYLIENFTQAKTVLSDEKEADRALQNWKPKEKLQKEQEQDQIYAFCSSPGCRKLYDESLKFRYCGACRISRYCSEECQKDHWKKSHKDACLRDPTDACDW
ncbi:uncharacterized protein LOC128556511 [Mercenaria mercenaria]|uniref:uncharacterized protein LOC128556511 n=1 Tax=Mercenaria mercenaria TaxID=6596 RepID=UPI00234F3FDE|nr:uncharacterized protein LOC128556511 [Mercenaria mercenaria]